MLDQAPTPAERLEVLKQQIAEAGEWDARPAALRRLRWIRDAAAIMGEADRQANAFCLKAEAARADVATDYYQQQEHWLGLADGLWEAHARASDLVATLAAGDEAKADLDLIERLLQGEG